MIMCGDVVVICEPGSWFVTKAGTGNEPQRTHTVL